MSQSPSRFDVSSVNGMVLSNVTVDRFATDFEFIVVIVVDFSV